MKKLLLFLAVALTATFMACEEPEIPTNVELGTNSLTFEAVGGQKSITFDASHDWTAEVKVGAEWITLSAMSGVAAEAATINVQVAENSVTQIREGKIAITVKDKVAEVTVSQAAKVEDVVTPTGLIVPEPIYRPDVLTPVNYVADYAEGGMDGVTIEITAKETGNFKFQVRPGANIQSYRMDVYPLTRLYNSLYEAMRQSGANMSVQLDEELVENMIRDFIFDEAGAGAFTFSVNNLEDYLNHEFDWMNSSYAQAKIVPDCEYVIAAVGCFDTEGMDQGDMTLCYVRTPYQALIGNPVVGMDVITSFDAMQITYLPNADCKYFYQWVSNYEDLQPFIDIYGEKLYADFMRNAVYQPTSREDVENHTYYVSFGLTASSEVPLMATAIGLDENRTPSPEFQYEVFSLKTRPEESAAAVSTITIDEDHIGAGIFWMDVTMGANCSAAVMKVYTKDVADEIMALSKEEQAEYATLIYQDGWGFSNQNYLYNRETDELIGSGYEMSEVWSTANPDTEYVIVWTAMNQYRELAPLQFTEPFRTLPIVLDNPAASEENAVLNLTHTGVQRVNIEFTYDFDKTALIHFQYITGFDNLGTAPTEESSREELLAYLYQSGDAVMGAYSANHWWTVPSGRDYWSDILNPNTSYTIAYVAEDWNGVMGEVKFATTKTDALQGGDNPQASITGQYTMTDNIPYFQFDMGQDAMQLYYMSSSDDALNFKNLGDKRKLRYKDVQPAWESYCMEYALHTYAITSKQEASHGEIALCIPVGGSADAPIFGSLEHLIYADDDGDGNGEFRDLGYYYPEEYAADQESASVSVSPLRQQVVKNVMRPTSGMKASELPEVEYGKRRVRFGEIAPNATLIEIDYNSLSSHPHATGR